VKQFRVENHRLRFLSQEEISRLLGACHARIYPAVVCAIMTGMRRGEILRLSWKDVDLEHKILYVLESKSGKPREMPIAGKLHEVLATLGPKQGLVFDIPVITLRRYFDAALKKAGIQEFRFHDLRHTFASHYIMRTNDLPALQALLGHHSPVMTQRYAHLSRTHLKGGIELLDSAMDTIWTPRRFGPSGEEQKAQ
jgi:integrase